MHANRRRKTRELGWDRRGLCCADDGEGGRCLVVATALAMATPGFLIGLRRPDGRACGRSGFEGGSRGVRPEPGMY